MLGIHGFEAYGLEFSANAIAVAREYARSTITNGKQLASQVDMRVNCVSGGSVQFLTGDFFERAWQSSLPFEPVQFDLVYDYTVALSKRRTFKNALRKLTVPTISSFALCCPRREKPGRTGWRR